VRQLKFIGRVTRPAFTLIEMVISLVVLILCTQLLLVSVRLLGQMTTLANANQQNISWQIGMVQLDRFLEEAYFMKHKTDEGQNKIIFKKQEPDNIYHLKQVKQELVVVSQDEGYMPLIGNLRRIQFSYHEPMLSLQGTFKDGTVYQHRCYMEQSHAQ